MHDTEAAEVDVSKTYLFLHSVFFVMRSASIARRSIAIKESQRRVSSVRFSSCGLFALFFSRLFVKLFFCGRSAAFLPTLASLAS